MGMTGTGYNPATHPQMEWLKITLERLFGFIVAVIPGGVVLVLFGIHHPQWAIAIRDISYLGYRTKITLTLVIALITGWTVITMFTAITGGLEGAFAGMFQKWLAGEAPKYPPWRNKNWRALLIKHLGSAAPEDLELISDETLAVWIEAANLNPNLLQRTQGG